MRGKHSTVLEAEVFSLSIASTCALHFDPARQWCGTVGGNKQIIRLDISVAVVFFRLSGADVAACFIPPRQLLTFHVACGMFFEHGEKKSNH